MQRMVQNLLRKNENRVLGRECKKRRKRLFNFWSIQSEHVFSIINEIEFVCGAHSRAHYLIPLAFMYEKVNFCKNKRYIRMVWSGDRQLILVA